MPADLVAIAILVVLAALAAPVAADCRRRLATRRFDALYERNLLRRTGRG
jgi:type II secretory pathway pseudopilin PulG